MEPGNTTSNEDSGIETDQMEGFSVNPDSGMASASGDYEGSSSSRGDANTSASAGAGAGAGAGADADAGASASDHNSTATAEDPERQHHFGPSNPLGPIPSAPSDGRTTKSTTTEEDGRGSHIHTSVYTTVCTSGQAYRTTRVTNAHRLLSATYEQSVPLGTTHRIIRTYHRGTNDPSRPYYDQTTETIKPGGSTTVRHQKFDMTDRPMNPERVQEYPPMEITPKPGWTAAATLSPMAAAGRGVSAYFGFGGGGGGGGSSPNAGGGGNANHEDITVISELSNPRISRPIDVDEQHTLAGMTTRYDDPTVDPTVIDYHAGYSEEMARKHNAPPPPQQQQMAVGDVVGGIGYDAERAVPPRPPGVEAASSPASSNRSGKKSFGSRGSHQSNGSKPNGAGSNGNANNGHANWSMVSENDYSRSNHSGASPNPTKRRRHPMSTQTKLIIFGTGVLIVAIAVGAAVGAVTAKSGGGKTNGGGNGGDSGDDSADDLTPTPAPGPGRPPTQPPAPLTTEEILTNSGFGRHWQSEEGWPVAPSYASFVPNEKFELGEASYYDAFYLPDLAMCADRCDKTDSAGGAYFDLSEEDKRNVCLCFKDAQCYDTKLVFSGGTVFVREENYIPESEECQMSTCGYFPDDPICDGLNIIDVESELDVELRKVERLMQDGEIRAFQRACADFLNGEFSQTDSPVEGVRCHLLTQDLTGRRLTSSATRTLQENDTLLLEMRVTGLFVPTSKYADADSVAFDATILDFFSQQGSDFLQSLRNDENAKDYYENVRGISIKTSGFPSEPVPEPTPASPTDAPSPSPTRMPVTWPTTDAPSRRPTRSPTIQPSRAPTKSPTARPTSAPTSLAATPLPTLPPVPSEGNPAQYCLGQKCWRQVGSTMTSNFLGDQFGDEVKLDLSGGRFSVSASLSSESGYLESGTVKVYDEEDGNFIRVGQELYGFEAGDRIRGVLSGNGRRLALYSHKRDIDTGRVWIYELQNEEWVEIWQVLGQSEGERFGSSVALNTDGNIVAIGAPFAYDKQGAVRVYAERNGNWRQLGNEILGQFRDGKLGWDVAFASNALMLVAGQKSDDNNSVSGRSGQVRVFQYSGSNVNANGSFEQFGQAILGDNPGDDFGRTVAISATGTIVAAGARYHDGAGRVDSGQVKARSYFGGGLWFEIKGSEIIGDNANDQLMNLAMNAAGDRIAAGAGQGNGGLGYIKVYDNASGNGWEQIGGRLVGLDDNENFGSDISMSANGKRLLTGSPAGDNNAIPARVRLFELVDK